MNFKLELKRNFFLYLLALPGILFFLIFKYIPMIGIVIAFQDYNALKGIFKSEFVGFKNFVFFFTSKDWLVVTFNTIYLNILFIITGLFFSILIAIVLSEINSKHFKKITQSIVILPNFISWTLASMFVFAVFATEQGYINSTLKNLGLLQVGEEIQFFADGKMWPVILMLLRIWKGAGFGSIVYLATIAGIDQEIYAAAKVDGASRMQLITRITLPHLKTTAVLLTIFGIGGIFHGDLGMIYAVVGDNPNLFAATDVIDTYVFRMLRQVNDISMSSAIGLYQSFVGFLIVFGANALAKKFDADSAIF